MKKQQLGGLCALLAVTAAVCWGAAANRNGGSTAGEETASLAAVTGETASPDGQYRVRAISQSEADAASLETLEIVDAGTGKAVWTGEGDGTRAALWSADGEYLALASGGQSGAAVEVFETETWTSRTITLPDGALLSEDWGAWVPGSDVGPETLRLKAELGGGKGEMVWRCLLLTGNGSLEAEVMSEVTQTLSGAWDFDGDGAAETVEVVSVGAESGNAGWYELNLRRGDGTLLWSDTAAGAHVGWNTIAACTVDGRDCLLRYIPSLYQGWAEYSYTLFSLGADGTEETLRESAVTWDINLQEENHRLDAGAVADFLWEVRELLDGGTILLSTEDGTFQSDIPGLELHYEPFGDLLALGSREATEEAVRTWAAEESAG